MKISVLAATDFELAAIRERWPRGAYAGALDLDYAVTGVGIAHAAVNATAYLCARAPELVLHVGIAGALDRQLALGQVVHVVSEEWGDIGAEDGDGAPLSLFDLGLADAEAPPYRAGRIAAEAPANFLPRVSGVTVARAHGSAASIAAFRERSDAQVESMEGAAVALAAALAGVPSVQIRAISNYVTVRDRDAWRVPEALAALTEAVDRLLSSFPGAPGAAAARRQLGR